MGHYVFSNLEFACYIEQVIFELIPKEYYTTVVIHNPQLSLLSSINVILITIYSRN